MERLSDAAIEIVNELHRERIDYSGEYLPLIDALGRLASYEDTGLEPQTISEILDSVSEWYDAHKEGRLLVLPCEENTPMYRVNVDMYGKPASISPTYFNLAYYRPADVGTKLFFTREEAEEKLKESGGE